MGVCFVFFVGLNLILRMNFCLKFYMHSSISVFVQHVSLQAVGDVNV